LEGPFVFALYAGKINWTASSIKEHQVIISHPLSTQAAHKKMQYN